MEQKQQFVTLAGSGHFTVTELCEQFGISRKTGHKWLSRHAVGGMKALEERSRTPKSVTCRTSEEIERLIVVEKRLHPAWGPKKTSPKRQIFSMCADVLVGLSLDAPSGICQTRIMNREAIFTQELMQP